MKNFQEKITFEIDENRFGIFVAAFRAAAPQCLFGGANINKAGPIFGGAQSFNGENQFWRKAGERLRAAKDWPRFVYIRPTEQALRRSGAEGRDKDTKPVFVDLESYLFLEIFHRWLMKAGELEVTEMLPTPDDLWWQERDGRRTFELRTLVVPRT